MYLEHFQLTRHPFQINSDPDFLWYGEKHEEALATLKYGLNESNGFLLLTGDIGLGKTTIIYALLKLIDDNDLAVLVNDPGLEKLDFFNFIASSFGMPGSYSTKGTFIRDFESFLLACHREGRRVLLIIDEAQRLNQELLEEIRLLSNLEKKGAKLIKIFFVGQTEFNKTLLRPENKAVRQRITVNYNIEPLTVIETGKYLEFRLAAAGATRKIFRKDAIEAIHHFSKGYPRLINIIADRAMLTTYIHSASHISRKTIIECASELDISRAVIPKKPKARSSKQIGNLQKAADLFNSVDSKMLRKALDDLGLARTSLLRMAITRICRAAADIEEFQSTLKEEALRIGSNANGRNELKVLLNKNDVTFLDPIIRIFYQTVFQDTSLKPVTKDRIDRSATAPGARSNAGA